MLNISVCFINQSKPKNKNRGIFFKYLFFKVRKGGEVSPFCSSIRKPTEISLLKRRQNVPVRTIFKEQVTCTDGRSPLEAAPGHR